MFLGGMKALYTGKWSTKLPDLARYQYAKENFKKNGQNEDLHA